MKVKDCRTALKTVQLDVKLPILPDHDFEHPLEPIDATDTELRAALQDLQRLDDDVRALVVRQLRSLIAVASQHRSEGATFDPSRRARPKLSDETVQAIIRHGKRRQWSERPKTERLTCVEWVRRTYKDWIPGLLQSHILAADPPLYAALQKYIQRNGLPADLDIPSLKEAHDREGSPERNAARLHARLAAAYFRKANSPE